MMVHLYLIVRSLSEQMPVIIRIGTEILLRITCCIADDADQHIKGIDIRIKCNQAFQHLWNLLFLNERLFLLKTLHQIARLAAFCMEDLDPKELILGQQYFTGDIPFSIRA